jgi:hypothetical protein
LVGDAALSDVARDWPWSRSKRIAAMAAAVGTLTDGSLLSEDGEFANITSDGSIPVTDGAMSPLRRRMIEDMTICKLSPIIRSLRWRAAAASPDKRAAQLALALAAFDHRRNLVPQSIKVLNWSGWIRK